MVMLGCDAGQGTVGQETQRSAGIYLSFLMMSMIMSLHSPEKKDLFHDWITAKSQNQVASWC
jgi:hypothetical protein